MPRVSVVQLPARFGQVDAQLEQVAQLVPRGSTDLVLLPETALTGYVSPRGRFDLARFAEPLAQGVERLVGMARALECDVVGPVVEATEAGRFNTTVGVGRDGVVWLHYRKRHPWYPETWATAGDLAWPLVTWRGLRVTCAVCFDVHFLAEEAAAVLAEAELLLYPSAWVDEAGDARTPLLRELATRFGVTVLNANWGPGVPAVPGQGGSMVVRPGGKVERLGEGGVLRVEVGGSTGSP